MNRFDHWSNNTLYTSVNHNAARGPNRSSHPRSRLLLVLGLSAIVIFSLGLAISACLNRPPEATDQPVRPVGDYKDDFYTFLVVGTDEGNYHTDTIMVISLDTANHKANIVSVPRDTQVDVPRNPKKINTAYAVGGVEQLKQEIKSILGFRPNYYIVVDLKAFEKLVDATGGVKFAVPQDMNKDDFSQGLHIHLKKGAQTLDGDKALQLVRYRDYINADIGRMETQQNFLMALANELLVISNIPKINEFVDIIQQYVETDLPLRDLQWFARQVMQLDQEKDLTMQTLPYSGFGDYRGHSYVYLEAEEVVGMVNRTINPYTRAITVKEVKIIRLED